MFQLLSGSVKKLLNDVNFIAVIKKKSEPKTGVEISTNSIEIQKVISPGSYSEAIQSAVTLRMHNSHGSGFLISNDGYILSNYHVVEGEKTVNVILNSGISLLGRVVKVDKDYDLALIKIQGNGFKPLGLSLVEIMVGADVVAIGTPNKIELGQTITKGIISGKREFDGHLFIQTDVSVSPGNSGGPLLNQKNEVIGIINSKLIEKGVEGIAFAIPINVALNKLGILIK